MHFIFSDHMEVEHSNLSDMDDKGSTKDLMCATVKTEPESGNRLSVSLAPMFSCCHVLSPFPLYSPCPAVLSVSPLYCPCPYVAPCPHVLFVSPYIFVSPCSLHVPM